MTWPLSLGVIVSGVALQTDGFLIADLPAHLWPRFSLAGSPEEATQLRTYNNPHVFPNSCFTPAALFSSMSSPNKLKYTTIAYLFHCVTIRNPKGSPSARSLRSGKAVLRCGPIKAQQGTVPELPSAKRKRRDADCVNPVLITALAVGGLLPRHQNFPFTMF